MYAFFDENGTLWIYGTVSTSTTSAPCFFEHGNICDAEYLGEFETDPKASRDIAELERMFALPDERQ